MRRVTVRVPDDGDWHFRAERTDGQTLFEVEFSADGTAAPATKSAAPAPDTTIEPPIAELLDNPFIEQELDEAIKALGKNMPQGPAITRVLEIGGFIGSMTKRLHRMTEGERAEPVYMVDPFIRRCDGLSAYLTPELLSERNRLLKANVESIGPRLISGSEESAAASMAPMNVDLLCLSATVDIAAFADIVERWIPHLSPSGILFGRCPAGSFSEATEILKLLSMDVLRLNGDWFLATHAEAKS